MTRMQYLEDTYLFESSAKIVGRGRDDKFGDYLILDQTIFYPQGGGQAADIGFILNENLKIKILDVRLDSSSGEIFHFGEIPVDLELNQKVELLIDSSRRVLNARLHSAGHLIDNAITNLQRTGLIPVKGHFFDEGASIECLGVLENAEEFKLKLTEEVNRLVINDLKFLSKDLTKDEALKQKISAPKGKSVRVVSFEGFKFIGCGGTHVNSSKEIGFINIKKIKRKKDRTKISYFLD